MDMDFKNMPPEAAEMLKKSEMTIQIKNEFTRTETKTPMSGTVSVSDNKNQTAFTLLDMMGSKYLIRTNPDEIKKGTSRPDVKVNELPETKMIAGYKCKRAEVIVSDAENKRDYPTIVFFTTEIPYNNSYDNVFKGLNGFPLEYTISPDEGTHIKFTAKSVTKEKLNDSIFTVPAGYKETTSEELQKEMMQNFSGGEK